MGEGKGPIGKTERVNRKREAQCVTEEQEWRADHTMSVTLLSDVGFR